MTEHLLNIKRNNVFIKTTLIGSIGIQLTLRKCNPILQSMLAISYYRK